MIDKNITISFKQYDSLDELTAEQRKLLDEAYKAMSNAYAPYSNFHVGASLMDQDGNIFIGANMENAAFPMCICAEGSLLASYSSSGAKSPIVQVAVTASSANQLLDSPVAPCGACRQMLSEFENKQGSPITIILKRVLRTNARDE
ncbi:MAG: cytidine deaminase [Saprospiraceae bacterium]|nr:cytidine deaminase [Candidatus Brachybacter algidus]